MVLLITHRLNSHWIDIEGYFLYFFSFFFSNPPLVWYICAKFSIFQCVEKWEQKKNEQNYSISLHYEHIRLWVFVKLSSLFHHSILQNWRDHKCQNSVHKYTKTRQCTQFSVVHKNWFRSGKALKQIIRFSPEIFRGNMNMPWYKTLLCKL